MFFTILVHLDYPEENSINEKEYIDYNAHRVWKLANGIIWYLQGAINKMPLKAAVCLDLTQNGKFYDFKFDDINNENRRKSTDKFILDFKKSAKVPLNESPFEIYQIALSIWIEDDISPTDDDWLYLSQVAEIDFEAPVYIDSEGIIVMQGYSQGDYDTGYISNHETKDSYLLENPYNSFFFNAQDEQFILSKII